MIRLPPRSTLSSSSAASDVYKRQGINAEYGVLWLVCMGGCCAKSKDKGLAKPQYAPPIKESSRIVWPRDEHVSSYLVPLAKEYFQRYDFDGSGCVNSQEELRGFCQNLAIKLGMDWVMGSGVLDAFLHPDRTGDIEKAQWTFEETLGFFVAEFAVPRCLGPQDATDPGSDSEQFLKAGSGWLRRGSYSGLLRDMDGNESSFCTRLLYDRTRSGDGPMIRIQDRRGSDELGEWVMNGLVDDAGGTLFLVQEYTESGCQLEMIGEASHILSSDGEAHATCLVGTWKCLKQPEKWGDKLGLGAEGAFAIRKVSFRSRQVERGDFELKLGLQCDAKRGVGLAKDSMHHVLRRFNWQPNPVMSPRSRQTAYEYILGRELSPTKSPQMVHESTIVQSVSYTHLTLPTKRIV
eukprot:TRINITY_DN3991_c0_g2_i2.p1 TRINITY_DN3991_c0_g2~~TRINITY_DN3991_c0_g2_i2.p1  ORF type:complete len:406 (+),score=77.54 TRINITY_DN3991_c0_g2_i2:114-1331(+)